MIFSLEVPMRTLNKLVLRDWPLPHADDASDKEDRGQVLVVAGSREIPGAALLAATAAFLARELLLEIPSVMRDI